ncbi:hypothetical protein GCM10009640_11280 [Agrococcus citreus]|uniref:Zinc-finger of transposase IS204/IS1001/IS1096/IS1165 n=1 Tax=Agrococcus citreus TaxID=84643 RepID=A0ABN1YRR2_9MICO
MTHRLAHEPFGWRPTTPLLTIRRYRCSGCRPVWRQHTSQAAEPRARLSRSGMRWALEGIVLQHLTVARIAEASWRRETPRTRRFRPRADVPGLTILAASRASP